MTKPWQVAPLLAVAALAASAWWWQTGKNAWRAPPARMPELPAVAELPSQPVFHAQEALKRPLLWMSRRPISVGDPKGGFAKDLMESRLTAVFASGKDKLAILQRKDGSILKLSTDSKPWRIESFDGRKAVFMSVDQQRVERPLEHAASPEPKPGQPQGRPPMPPAGQ